jgi:hypothetical protein
MVNSIRRLERLICFLLRTGDKTVLSLTPCRPAAAADSLTLNRAKDPVNPTPFGGNSPFHGVDPGYHPLWMGRDGQPGAWCAKMREKEQIGGKAT